MTINRHKLPHKFPLLPRKKNTDKSHYGHALILAGSQGMSGAAILASRSALESGCGLVTLATPKSLIPIVAKSLPEVMQLALPETKSASAGASAFPKLMCFIQKRKINALLAGPGLSQNVETAKLVRKLISTAPVATVLDADGLNSYKAKTAELKGHAAPLVLTPHKKEFERLFLEKWPEERACRIKLAKRLSKFYDVVLVMKGPGTLVVCGDRCYINNTGNPGMAKGGAGDVLAGVITAFICQKLDPFLAASWAVYFHGRAADIAVKERGELGLVASDIIRFLPKAFRI
ncbi:MAG: NAD(P)H-hydrate dehydratase [Candidatus Omnitrophica bacterium CG1_02_46_14]|nr:MAG: NAD(P)H-hydrate dehydratase [Candidatus Omnitrophica bacterium CG1_02_46_14]